MGKGIGHRESSFPSFEGGEYFVKFGEWFPTDETGLPVLQTQKRFENDILVARYRTEVEGEETGPPGSIDPLKELGLFVKAFGGDPTTIPSLGPGDYDAIPRLLLNSIPQLKARVKVIVNDSGWISQVEGMSVDPGSKLVRFAGFTTFNSAGKPSWMKGKFGPISWGELRVVSGEYRGSLVKFLLAYPIEVNEEKLQPTLERIEGGPRDGEYTKPSARWKNFYEVFVGSIDDFLYERCEDVYNICPEVQQMALERKVVANVTVLDNGLADVNSLALLPEGVQLPDDIDIAPSRPPSAPETPPSEGLTPEQQAMLDSVKSKLDLARVVLRQAVTQEAGANAWIEDSIENWAMTDAGKAWAVENLVPIIQEIGCGKKFGDYTLKHILDILKSLGHDDLVKRIENPEAAANDSDF